MSERKKWTEEENAILKKYYQTIGKDIVNHLPGRTFKACRAQASKLGITYDRTRWSKEELDILIKYYCNMGTKVSFYIPRRSKAAIAAKAKSLGLTTRY